MSGATPARVHVSARRNIKGARRRELATHVGPNPPALAWLPNGAVDVYFTTPDGMCHVWLAADVVARIAAGRPTAPAPAGQSVPRLDGAPKLRTAGAALDQSNAPPGAVARQLWLLLSSESDRDGYALKPEKWEGPGEYQCVEYPDGNTTLVKVRR